tara:strand:- start:418 stop:666 length:249 start_codon:yes stop_codon:yes gene_type:complete
MSFKIGELVTIVSPINSSIHYKPPALIVDAYEGEPKIFLKNEKMGKCCLEEEDLGPGRVYDIFYQGSVEEAVCEEWLRSWLP